MSPVRDYLSDIPVLARLAANRVHVGASNTWHRTVGRRIQEPRMAFRIWRSSGSRAQVAAKVPVYRNRVNPTTGRTHRATAERIARDARKAQIIARNREGRSR